MYFEVTGPGRNVVLDSSMTNHDISNEPLLRRVRGERREYDETEDHDRDGKQGQGVDPKRVRRGSCLSGAPAGDRQINRGYNEVHESADGQGDQERLTGNGEDDLNHVGEAGHETPEDVNRVDEKNRDVRTEKIMATEVKSSRKTASTAQRSLAFVDRVGSAIATLRHTESVSSNSRDPREALSRNSLS